MSPQRNPFWWPETLDPEPRIVLSDNVRKILWLEARMSVVERLERMAIVVGHVQDNVFYAQCVIRHVECDAFGFVRSVWGKGLFHSAGLKINMLVVREYINNLLIEEEQAILAHSHFGELFSVEPSSADETASELESIAELIFEKLWFPPRFRAVACAGKREISVFHNGKKLNRMFR